MRNAMLILLGAALLSPDAALSQDKTRDIRPDQAQRVSDPALHIRLVVVQPEVEKAVITFEARANLDPVVEIRGPGMRPKSLRAGGERRAGKYRAEVTGLAPGTRYSYTITVASNDPRRPHRLDGNFTTERPLAELAAKGEKLTENVAYHIRDVTVVPGAEKVTISFYGRPNVVPILEIGKGPPRKNLDGRLEFRPEHLFGGYPVGGRPATGFYHLDVANVTALSQGTTFHYIINAPSGDIRRPHQVTGSFSTKSRTVTLRFIKFAIVQDGDRAGKGEMYFNIWVNNEEKLRIGSHDKPVVRESGEEFQINQDVVIENAPERLVIHVEALEDDSDVLSDFGFVGAFGEAGEGPAYHGPGRDGSTQWNAAIREIELDREPKFWKHVIPSKSLGASKSELAFTVTLEVHNPAGR